MNLGEVVVRASDYDRSAVEGVSAKTTEVIKSNPGRIAIFKRMYPWRNKKFEGPPETHAAKSLRNVMVWMH